MNINICPCHQDDLETVSCILWETWKKSYSSFIPVDDLSLYFNEHCTSKKLAEQYNDTQAIGFVAECDNVIAGYEKTYYNEKENRLYVHQLYVLPAFQNLGLGKKLMKSAAERAKSLGLEKVWLGVMIKNESAIAWYKKMGYEVVENLPFTMGRTTVDHFIGFIPIRRILIGDK